MSDSLKPMNCPVCGGEMDKAICKSCGYFHIIFPKELPESLQKFEALRINIMRNTLKHKELSGKSTKADPQVAQSPSEPRNDVAGTLVIRSLLTDSDYVFPIYRGRNIFGAKESDGKGRHHIDPLEIGIDIPDTMFAIDALPSGFRLLTSKNCVLSHDRRIIESALELENDVYFFYSNQLCFNAVRF